MGNDVLHYLLGYTHTTATKTLRYNKTLELLMKSDIHTDDQYSTQQHGNYKHYDALLITIRSPVYDEHRRKNPVVADLVEKGRVQHAELVTGQENRYELLQHFQPDRRMRDLVELPALLKLIID